jgi:hypothetical protein
VRKLCPNKDNIEVIRCVVDAYAHDSQVKILLCSGGTSVVCHGLCVPGVVAFLLIGYCDVRINDHVEVSYVSLALANLRCFLCFQ